MGAEIFHTLKRCSHGRGLSTAVGDEGGFAPTLKGTEGSLGTIIEAIRKAGYKPGEEVMIALDCASSEFYKDGVYDYSIFEGTNGVKRTSTEQVLYLEELIDKYPIRFDRGRYGRKRLGWLGNANWKNRRSLSVGG